MEEKQKYELRVERMREFLQHAFQAYQFIGDINNPEHQQFQEALNDFLLMVQNDMSNFKKMLDPKSNMLLRDNYELTWTGYQEKTRKRAENLWEKISIRSSSLDKAQLQLFKDILDKIEKEYYQPLDTLKTSDVRRTLINKMIESKLSALAQQINQKTSCFISYSWGPWGTVDVDHTDSVHRLASHLKTVGLDVILDIWDNQVSDITVFTGKIFKTDKVLVIGSSHLVEKRENYNSNGQSRSRTNEDYRGNVVAREITYILQRLGNKPVGNHGIVLALMGDTHQQGFPEELQSLPSSDTNFMHLVPSSIDYVTILFKLLERLFHKSMHAQLKTSEEKLVELIGQLVAEESKQKLWNIYEKIYLQKDNLKWDEELITHIFSTSFPKEIQSTATQTEDILKEVKNSAQRALKNYYANKKVIQGLFGKPLRLEDQYIHLQMLYQQQDETAEEIRYEDRRYTFFGFNLFREAWLNNLEQQLRRKITVEVSQLFLPARNIFKTSQKARESRSDESPHFLLIQGGAGTGKTTFVDYIAYEWSCGRLWKEDFSWIFVLRLRDLRQGRFTTFHSKGISLTLSEWVYYIHYVNQLEKGEFNTFWHEMIEPLLYNKVLFILDGYDELSETNPCQQALVTLLDAPIHKIITSRPYGVTSLLPYSRRDLEIAGFSDANIEKYIRFYFGEENSQIASTILRGLSQNPALWGNAHIPLVLNMMCGVLEKNTDTEVALTMLSTFSGLYQQMELKLLERAYINAYPAVWQQRFKHPRPEQQQIFLEKAYEKHRNVLSHLAFMALESQQLVMSTSLLSKAIMMNEVLSAETDSWIAENQFIEELLQTGLLKPVLDEKNPSERLGYEFLHLTFQEYYAGYYLPQLLVRDASAFRYILAEIKFNPRYQVVLWFTAGVLKQTPGQFKNFIEMLQQEPVALIRSYELGLLIRCTEEAFTLAKQLHILQPLRLRVQREIERLWKWYQYHIYMPGGQSNRLGRITDTSLIEPVWLSLLRLSPHWIHATGDEDLLALISDVHHQSIQLADFLGWLRLPSDVALNYLFQLLKTADSYMEKSLPTVWMLVTFWFSTPSANVRRAATYAINRLGKDAITPKFWKEIAILLQDKDVGIRLAALSAIKNTELAVSVPPTILAHLALLLKNEHLGIRRAALHAVYSLGTTAAVPLILTEVQELLKNAEVDVFKISYSDTYYDRTLLGSGTALVTSSLLTQVTVSLQDKNVRICVTTLYVICAFGEAAATPLILEQIAKLLQHPDMSILEITLRAIPVLGPLVITSDIWKNLVALLKYKWAQQEINFIGDGVDEYALRYEFYQAIRCFKSNGLALTDMVRLMQDPDETQRIIPLRLLRGTNLAVPEISQQMLVMLQDPHWKVRQEALAALRWGIVIPTSDIVQCILKLPQTQIRDITLAVLTDFNTTDNRQFFLARIIKEKESHLITERATMLIENILIIAIILIQTRRWGRDAVFIGVACKFFSNLLKFFISQVSQMNSNLIEARNAIIYHPNIAIADATTLTQIQELLITSNGDLEHDLILQITGYLDETAAASPDLLRTLIELLAKSNRLSWLGPLVNVDCAKFLFALLSSLLSSDKHLMVTDALKRLSHTLSSSEFQSRSLSPHILFNTFLLAYFSDHTSLTLQWDGTRYCLRGFIGKERFFSPLTLAQAQWCRRRAPELIERLNNLQFSRLFWLIFADKEWPLPDQDLLLFEYQNAVTINFNTLLSALSKEALRNKFLSVSSTQALDLRKDDPSSIIFDIRQDTYFYPLTGAQVFRYSASQDGKEKGYVDFYQHPLLCASADKTRHNILAATGIFTEVVKKIVFKEIPETCEAVPPTAWEEITLIASRSGIEGAK